MKRIKCLDYCMAIIRVLSYIQVLVLKPRVDSSSHDEYY